MRDLSRMELECMHHEDLIARVLDLQHQRQVWARATEATCVRNTKLAQLARSMGALSQISITAMALEVRRLGNININALREMSVIIEETENE